MGSKITPPYEFFQFFFSPQWVCGFWEFGTISGISFVVHAGEGLNHRGQSENRGQTEGVSKGKVWAARCGKQGAHQMGLSKKLSLGDVLSDYSGHSSKRSSNTGLYFHGFWCWIHFLWRWHPLDWTSWGYTQVWIINEKIVKHSMDNRLQGNGTPRVTSGIWQVSYCSWKPSGLLPFTGDKRMQANF